MARKTTFAVLAALAVVLLQFADCMSAMTPDRQSMQCCGSMPCNPSNQSHDCGKTMISPESPLALPAAHVTLHPPVMVPAESLALPQLSELSEPPRADFTAPQHSPPQLYTLHSSFLI